jgi:putative MFS transporter
MVMSAAAANAADITSGAAAGAAVTARLDRLPIGAFHWRLLALIGAGMFFDSFDIYLQGSVLGVLQRSGFSTLAQNAQFVSAGLTGMVIGAFGAGWLGDRFGRRFTYQFNLAIFGLASLASALAPDMTLLIATRFVCGIGLGAEIVIGYGTMIEFVPPSHRGRWGALLSLVTNFGLFAATLVAWLIIPDFGWRWMFAIAGIGAVFVLWLRKAMPESPRWLAARGREAEADALVAAVEATYPSLPAPAPPRKWSPADTQERALGGRLALGSLIFVVMNVATYGFVVWTPTFLAQHSMAINASLGQSVLVSLGGPAGAAIGVMLNDRVGRRPAIVVASLLGVVVGLAFAEAPTPELATLLGFVMFALIYFLVAVTFAGYVPELFPTRIRMRSSGFCNTIGRLVSIGAPLVVVPLYTSGGLLAVLSGVSAMLLLQAVVVGIAGRETKGRSLEEIAR